MSRDEAARAAVQKAMGIERLPGPNAAPFFRLAVEANADKVRKLFADEIAKAFEVPVEMLEPPHPILEGMRLIEARDRDRIRIWLEAVLSGAAVIVRPEPDGPTRQTFTLDSLFSGRNPTLIVADEVEETTAETCSTCNRREGLFQPADECAVAPPGECRFHLRRVE